MVRGVALVWCVLALVASACADDEPDRAERVDTGGSAEACDWPTAGGSNARNHATSCAETIDADNVERLTEMWFLPTAQEVTSAPAVDAERLYFGDWSGLFYGVNRADGALKWSVQTDVHPNVYAGQITATPALASIDGRDVVVFGGGRTVYALERSNGTEVWRHVLGDPADPEDTSEIEGGVAITGDRVVVGFDVHNDPTRRAGVVSLDLTTGEQQWYWDPEAGLPPGGCGDVWGAPAIDEDVGTVIVGTANCPRPESWSEYSEAIVSLDLATGEPNWSYQPHEKGNNQDWDFAGAPNLYEIDGRAVVGLGNKDGWYYVVDRGTGELIWKAEAQRQDSDDDGFAFGGFIGATSVASGVVVGGTAIGDCPCAHGFDAATGDVLWQNSEPSGTYAATAATPELAFLTGVDQTLRAFRLDDGEVVWSTATRAVSSSGPAIAGRELYLGVGFREPGTETPSAAAGMQAFRVLEPGEQPPETTETTLPDAGPAVIALQPVAGACIGAPCELPTRLKEPPPGTDPKISIEITTDPFRFELVASGLGPPDAWVRPGSAASEVGATVYGAFISTRDDQPQSGSVLCTFTEDEPGCTTDQIDRPADRYTRITVVAFADADTPPTLQDGIDRFVTTQGFDPPLVPKG